jgi:hypothetical protein
VAIKRTNFQQQIKLNKMEETSKNNETPTDAKPLLGEVNFWCKWLGHKLVPVFIKGQYNGKTVKFIACFCERCKKGENELYDIHNAAINREYGTYSESYFDR